MMRMLLLASGLLVGFLGAWLWNLPDGRVVAVTAAAPGGAGSARPTSAVPHAGVVAAPDPPPAVAPTIAPPTRDMSPAADVTLVVPVQGVAAASLSDTFDDARGDERSHQALDIMAPAGTPVLAVADGHLEKLFDSKPGGLTIYQFEPSGRFAYYYAHLQAYAPGLTDGQAVRQGDVIGYVGSTGNADPAAPHLHFAVFRLGPEREWWAGTPVNPYPLLRGTGTAR